MTPLTLLLSQVTMHSSFVGAVVGEVVGVLVSESVAHGESAQLPHSHPPWFHLTSLTLSEVQQTMRAECRFRRAILYPPNNDPAGTK